MGRKPKVYREYDKETGELIKLECYRCREIKNVSCFSKDKHAKDGVKNQCKQCCKQYCREYHRNNKEKISEIDRRYRENNKEKIAAKQHQRYENNKEKIYEKHLQWRKNNPDYDRQYRKKHKEKRSEINRQWRENNPDYGRQRYEKEVQQEIDKIHKNVSKKRYPNNGIQYGIIYGVQNLITNRWYIGQTTTGFNTRYHGDFFKYKHNELTEDNEKRKLLAEDIEKYGQENFKIFEVLDVAFSEKELDEKEAYYIDLYKAYDEGYNTQRGNIFKHGKAKRSDNNGIYK